MARRNSQSPEPCRGCGVEVFPIDTGTVFKKILVEAEPVWIRPETGGEMFVTIDGRTVHGVQAGDADDDPDTNFLAVYIPHKGRCPNNGRKPRNRQRRPSGYR